MEALSSFWRPHLHSSPFATAFPSHPLLHAPPSSSALPLSFKNPRRERLLLAHRFITSKNEEKSWSCVRSSSSHENPSLDSSARWLFEPIGDGDSRHIGYRVPLPNAFEIVSNVVTVGRIPEKADMVIPVATVSGLHARLEKKGGELLVTDLDSTNGTYINETKLQPGAVAAIPAGSSVIFGDNHLAIFRVTKLCFFCSRYCCHTSSEFHQAMAMCAEFFGYFTILVLFGYAFTNSSLYSTLLLKLKKGNDSIPVWPT